MDLLRIRIRIYFWIQGFDGQKLEKNLQLKFFKNVFVYKKNLQFGYP